MVIAIVILSLALAFSVFRWKTYKVSAYTLLLLMHSKYELPTKEELNYYNKLAIKKLLHIK